MRLQAIRDYPWQIATVGLVPFVGGLAMIVFGWITVRANERLMHEGAQATGTVVAVHKDNDDGGFFYYEPTVAFQNQAGQKRHIVGRFRDDKPSIGQQLTVYYDPNDVEHALVDGDERLWGWFLFVAALGGYLVALSGVVLTSLLRESCGTRNGKPAQSKSS